ncbi:hypothetical protein ABMY11_21630, partial [Vibrio vulnificus]
LNFIGLHLKTEINEALVTNSKHHRSPYISTTFMRFPCPQKPICRQTQNQSAEGTTKNNKPLILRD